jgi:hypothetical protein
VGATALGLMLGGICMTVMPDYSSNSGSHFSSTREKCSKSFVRSGNSQRSCVFPPGCDQGDAVPSMGNGHAELGERFGTAGQASSP